MAARVKAGARAVQERGRFAASKWLIARRASQLLILALFLAGPLAGVWLVKGNLASSLTLEVLPLTDPFLLLQTLLTGHWPELTAFTGALIVVAFYLLVGGRVYCSWVCPVNMVTDAAAWLQDRLGIRGTAHLSRAFRYWMIAAALVLAVLTGSLAWELVNPVSIVYRGLVFGMGMAWFVILAVFLFDLVVSRRGWCGHICPVGAFYSLVGRVSLLRVSATSRDQCDDCMDCYAVCPEPQVIQPALKGAGKGIGPVIRSGNCTNCGRCIDVCTKDVFEYGIRFSDNSTTQLANQREVTP